MAANGLPTLFAGDKGNRPRKADSSLGEVVAQAGPLKEPVGAQRTSVGDNGDLACVRSMDVVVIDSGR